MEDKKVAIKVETLDRLGEGFQESRGITHKLTTEEMIELAKVPIGENKLAQILGRSITEITAEDLQGVNKIGAHAFYGCLNLIDVTIPNNVTSIDSGAFNTCYYLERITMGDGIMNFIDAMNVFTGCNNLKAVYFDGDIGFWCRGFYNANSNPLYLARKLYVKNANGEYEPLSNLIIPNSVASIGKYAFYYCGTIESVTIPNSVTSIGDCAFGNLINCKNVTISNGVTSIGSTAFQSCNFPSVTIPNSVTSIGGNAFQSCQNLTSINIGNGIMSIGNNTFMGCHKLTDIYIDKPEGSISGAPWGSQHATVHWNTPLPSEEV